MHLLDTDVMIDVLRGYPPAVAWLRSLSGPAPGLPGFVVMELMAGCPDSKAQNDLLARLAPFRVHWPTSADCDRALATFAAGHLSHGLGLLDALIGECAVGLGASLCTFNARHFGAVPNLRIERPYSRPPAAGGTVP